MQVLSFLLSFFLTTMAAVGHAQARPTRAPIPGAPAGVAAFVNVNVVPMDRDRVLLTQTVLIEGGWITAFRSWTACAKYRSACPRALPFHADLPLVGQPRDARFAMVVAGRLKLPVATHAHGATFEQVLAEERQ